MAKIVCNAKQGMVMFPARYKIYLYLCLSNDIDLICQDERFFVDFPHSHVWLTELLWQYTDLCT